MPKYQPGTVSSTSRAQNDEGTSTNSVYELSNSVKKPQHK